MMFAVKAKDRTVGRELFHTRPSCKPLIRCSVYSMEQGVLLCVLNTTYISYITESKLAGHSYFLSDIQGIELQHIVFTSISVAPCPLCARILYKSSVNAVIQ